MCAWLVGALGSLEYGAGREWILGMLQRCSVDGSYAFTSGRVKTDHPFLGQYGAREHKKGAEILLGNKGDTPLVCNFMS